MRIPAQPCSSSTDTRRVKCCNTEQFIPFRRRRPVGWLLVAAAALALGAATFAAPTSPPTVPAPERATAAMAAVEELLGHLDVSIDKAEFASVTAPHRLLAEAHGAVDRLAATRQDLIGQPWHVARPLLRRLHRAEERTRTLLGRLEHWQPRLTPSTPLLPQGTGALTGVVTAAANGAPLAGVHVEVVSYYGGDLLATALTNASGNYTASGLGAETVAVRTTGTVGFVDAVYDDVPCEPSCSSYYGTPIEARNGMTISGVNFALAAAATLSGRVTSTVDGAGIVGVEVSVGEFGSGTWLASATTAADGVFSIPELSPGLYWVLASHGQWADELYNNVPCEPSCGSMAGTPVFLSAGQNIGEIDFALDPTGGISGHVVNGATGEPGYAEVAFYNQNGLWVAYTYTGTPQRGEFSLADLPAGSYFAVAQSWPWSQLYHELPWIPPYDATSGTPIVVASGQNTPNIDFTVDTDSNPKQAISGQVTDSADHMPLEASIDVFDATGSYAGYAYSSSTGHYRASQLVPGTYFVTANASAYLGELYDNVLCGPDCDPRTGTTVVVTATAETTGIDFGLNRGGWIAGQVTGADTGGLLSGAPVTVFDSTGEVVSSFATDETGHYAVFGLGTGSYFVVASAGYFNPDYADQLYSGILCETGCTVTSGTPVAVTAGVATAGIDFALTPLGSVSGTITNAATGLPIAGATVHVWPGSYYGDSATTDAAGHYRVHGVHSGTVHVTADDSAFRDELYDNIPCEALSCTINSGAPVLVTAGNVTTNIDFALDRLGTISGHVTRAANGQPLVNASVLIHTSSGYQQQWVRTNEAGDYSAVGLVTGTYFVRTYLEDGVLVDELYDNLPCDPSCNPVSGTPITVVEGQATAGINFALDTGGTISGKVTDEQSGTPVAYFTVTAYGSAGSTSAQTGSDGQYTLQGLPSGTYFVKASRSWNSTPYAGELYNNIPCEPSCTVTTGTPVAVTAGSSKTGIDFALSRLGGISGRVTEAAGGLGLQTAQLQAFDSAGTLVRTVYADQTAQYSIQLLGPGTYFVKASLSGYASEVFDNVTCDPTCVVTTGTPVTVTAGATTSGINLALARRGSISGRLTLDPGGAPISGVGVNVYNATGSWFADVTSGPDGTYLVSDLPTGTYFLRTVGTAHHNELYDNIPCESGCTVTSGTPVTVVLGVTTSGRDFALRQRGAISGKVVDQTTGGPVLRSVYLYAAAGNYAAYAPAGYNGTFTFTGLAPGAYFVRTYGNSWETDEFVDELYNDIPCDPDCTVTTGTPINVTDGATTTGIDFALKRHGRITGRVTDAQLGLPVQQRDVLVYDSSGTIVSSTSSDGAGNFSTWYLLAGTYYVITQSYGADDPWVDQLWEGRECDPSCTPTRGTPIVVANGTVTSGINFALYKPYFADVPLAFWARSHIDAIYRAGITSGCGSDPLVYCPASEVSRAQLAVLLGVAGHGPGFTLPPATGTVFEDVPIGYWAAAWIELLWADGLTAGCASDPLRYCPESPLSRAEMSVFLLGAKHGPGYQPPPATGAVFADVPITHWAAAWIEELAREGITAGCAPAMFCPADPVDRAQMAVFLVTVYPIPY